MKIILGSSSAKRKILLEAAGIHIGEIMSPDVDEKAVRSRDFAELVLMLARAKREALRPRISEPVLLITADTVLFHGGDLYEKPSSEEEERKFLKSYDGVSTFGFVTGLTVTNTATGETREGTEDGEFTLGPFSDEFIERYIQEGEYKQYAGGFTFMDSRVKSMYKHVRGGTDTLMGMPIKLLQRFLDEVR